MAHGGRVESCWARPELLIPGGDQVTADVEVVAPLDLGSSERLDRRIRLMADTIRDNIAKLAGLIEEAKQGQIHVALGFASWTAYLADALGGRLELDTDSRREVVALMAGEGMSQRAIAQAVGVSQKTVDRDLDKVTQVSHGDSPDDEDHEEPADPVVVAQVVDELPAIAGGVQQAGATDRDDIDELVDWQLSKSGTRSRSPRRSRPVTGLDGKTYTRTKPKTKAESARPAATFAQLMKRLTELNRVAAECADIAEKVRFKAGANWSGLTYDNREQYDSASALAEGLVGVANSILEVIRGSADDDLVIDAEVVEAVVR